MQWAEMNSLLWSCNFALWSEASARFKTKQAKPLNTPTNLDVHNSASPLKAFRVTSDTAQKKKILREGRRVSRAGPAPEAARLEINRKYHTPRARDVVVRVWRQTAFFCLCRFFWRKEVEIVDGLSGLVLVWIRLWGFTVRTAGETINSTTSPYQSRCCSNPGIDETKQLSGNYYSTPIPNLTGAWLWNKLRALRRGEQLENDYIPGAYVFDRPPSSGGSVTDVLGRRSKPGKNQKQAIRIIPPLFYHLVNMRNPFSLPHTHSYGPTERSHTHTHTCQGQTPACRAHTHSQTHLWFKIMQMYLSSS